MILATGLISVCLSGRENCGKSMAEEALSCMEGLHRASSASATTDRTFPIGSVASAFTTAGDQ